MSPRRRRVAASLVARVPPGRLALWSFLVAMAHGAGLMLVPICLTVGRDPDHSAAGALIGGNLAVAAIVALVHTAAMTLSGGALALGVYHWLGLRFLSRRWFVLDVVWALSLVLVGVVALAVAH